MEHSSLVAFLKGTVAPERFGDQIAGEVAACNGAFRSGGVGYIAITDGPLTVVTRDHAKCLLQAIADGRLTFEAANYTADCLIMSDDFEFADDAVRGAIYFIEDDSIAPTVDEVRTAVERLSR